MIDLNIASKINSDDFLKKAIRIASSYGFDDINKIETQQKKQIAYTKEKTDKKNLSLRKPLLNKIIKQKPIIQHIKIEDIDTLSSEIIHAIQTVADKEIYSPEHPMLICQNNIARQDKKFKNFGLIAIGMKKSIAEALLIKTASAILEDTGIGEMQVYINSIGDKTSSVRFVNELNLYFRKKINSVPHQIRQSIKKDIFKAYRELYNKYSPPEEDMPQSIKFLSDNNRKHLSELLEYLETSSISYEIDNFLIGNNKHYSQTLFEIRNPNRQKNDFSIFAKGGRCDELVKNVFRVDIPVAGMVLEFENKEMKGCGLQNIRTKKPKAYFVQLGSEAKKKSLTVIDVLRKANIQTCHSLDNDKFSEQFALAQYFNVPYTIIMGHREALDNTVIVRNMDTQFQHTILVEELPKYLKSINI